MLKRHGHGELRQGMGSTMPKSEAPPALPIMDSDRMLEVNEKVPNSGAQDGPPKAQMEYLSSADMAFVRRSKQVLCETQHELDGICVLLPRVSSMSGEDADRVAELFTGEVTDYILTVGYMISFILERDVNDPRYRYALSNYIQSFDWEGIVLPFSSMEAAFAAALRCKSELVFYPMHLTDVLTRFCLKLSLRAELLMHRNGPLSWSETGLIRDDAARLLNMGAFV